ncbi:MULTISPECIES: hypothetical protein [unclassified Bradyrhizobium]|uniref:hypothetical protein n=1 Tax=unclassified Bradyrhizobium TaxID=2631580 RepID=UPI0028ED1F1B|nr:MULTISPECIES: hypothetical protein [unclassified Bradyrhizobium]
MSKDKQKKYMRAMEFLRTVNAERRAPHSGVLVLNRKKLPPVIRYCVERGLARLRRKRLGKNATFTVLDTGLHDHG